MKTWIELVTYLHKLCAYSTSKKRETFSKQEIAHLISMTNIRLTELYHESSLSGQLQILSKSLIFILSGCIAKKLNIDRAFRKEIETLAKGNKDVSSRCVNGNASVFSRNGPPNNKSRGSNGNGIRNNKAIRKFTD